MINLSKVSEALKELMEEHNLTQAELAAKLGTGRTKFSDILNCKSAPNYTTMIKLVDFFNCSADYLLGLNDYPCEDVAYNAVCPIGERLRTLLAQSGKSQYNLVNSAKISWSVLHGWLAGKTWPSADNLIKLANYFDCSVDFLLGRV